MTHLPNLQLHKTKTVSYLGQPPRKERTTVSQQSERPPASSGGATRVIRGDGERLSPRRPVRVVPDDQPDNSPEVKAETTEKVRKPPEDVALPQRGFYGRLYMASCKIGFPDHCYKRLTAADLVEQEIGLGEEWLHDLSNVEGMQFSITTANNQGGSSKSISACYPGSIISNITHLVIYVAPATANTKTARVALVAGVDPMATLKISEFAGKADKLTDFTKLDQLVQRNKYGLRVIANDPSEGFSIDHEFGDSNQLRVARVLESKATIRIWDQGNDNVNRGGVGLEATRRSDLMIVPTTLGHVVSQYGMSETLGAYMSDHTTADEFEESVPEMARISTSWKAANSLVVINKLGKGMDPEEFRRYTKRVDAVGNVVGDLGWHGDYLAVGDDPYIGDPSPDTIKVDLDAILRTTYRDYLMEALMIFVKVGRQRGMALPSPSPKLVDIWQRRGMKPINLRPAPAPLLAKPQ
jgi:hypothetical protein